MTKNNTHKTSGLYNPIFEKDNCGFGLIANMDDDPSHWVIETSINALNRLTHRGAVADDGKTSDGCGLLIKKPHEFCASVAKELDIKLSKNYAFGVVFTDNKKNTIKKIKEVIHFQLRKHGLDVAGWREVPTNSKVCGQEALKNIPSIYHVIINAPDDLLET